MSRLLEVAKAFAGAAASAAIAAYTARATTGALTSDDIKYIVGAAIVGGVLVFLTPNKKPAPPVAVAPK